MSLDRWHSHLLWKGPRRDGECLGEEVRVECAEWVWMCEGRSRECDVCRCDGGDEEGSELFGDAANHVIKVMVML